MNNKNIANENYPKIGDIKVPRIVIKMTEINLLQAPIT